jgi:hypothetical protein
VNARPWPLLFFTWEGAALRSLAVRLVLLRRGGAVETAASLGPAVRHERVVAVARLRAELP